MNKNQEIVLGLTKVIKKVNYDSESEEDEEFISKIGGQPLWMQKKQAPKEVLCKACQQPMIFILQLYSPLQQSYAYHRSLYVFQCLTPTCLNRPEQLRVFRCQFSKENKLQETTEQGQFQKKLEKEFKIITDIETKQEAQEFFWTAQNEIDSFALNDKQLQQIKKNQPKATKNERELEMAKQYAKQLIDQKEALQKDSQKGGKQQVDEDSDDSFDMEQKDKAFIVYNTFINQIGPHVIRFCRNKISMPLWFSDKNQWNEKQVGKCFHCGGNRIFEFQINNCLLNMYKELIVQDWGIAVIYSCEKSCQVKDEEYVEEVCLLQVGTEDPSSLKQIQEKIQILKQEEEKWKAEHPDDDEDIDGVDFLDEEQLGGLSKEELKNMIKQFKQNIKIEEDQQQNEFSQGLQQIQEQSQEQKPKKKKNKNKIKNKQNQESQQQQQKEEEQQEEDDMW